MIAPLPQAELTSEASPGWAVQTSRVPHSDLQLPRAELETAPCRPRYCLLQTRGQPLSSFGSFLRSMITRDFSALPPGLVQSSREREREILKGYTSTDANHDSPLPSTFTASAHGSV